MNARRRKSGPQCGADLFGWPPTVREMGGGWEPLLAAARDDLYQKNGFRVLQIAVDASLRQISRGGQLLQMQQKYGGGTARRTVISLDPPPDDVAVRKAIQRLSDPARRLVDEFFWFWPAEPGGSCTDEALAALSAGQTQKAYETWKQQEQSNGQAVVATHNIAVLAHLRALDLESSVRTGSCDSAQAEQLQRAWRQCFARWEKLLMATSLWQRLAQRVVELGDPRVRPEMVAQFRASLPLALLLINARMAVEAAGQCCDGRTNRHLAIIRKSSFSADYVSEACRRAIAPTREVVRVACQGAKQRTERDPLAGANAAMALLQETARPLSVLDAILPGQDAVRVSAHDEVAATALGCQVAFGNQTEDWITSLCVLERVAPVPVSGSLRRRIEENIRIVRGNMESGNFWCGEGYWALPQSMRDWLERAREHHRLKQFDQAIAVLERMVGDVNPASLAALPDNNPYRLVARALSVCLNSRALSRLDRAIREFERLLPILLRIVNNPAYLAPGPGLLCCAVCGTSIYGAYSILTFKGIKITLCSRCAARAKREQEQKNSSLQRPSASRTPTSNGQWNCAPTTMRRKNTLNACRKWQKTQASPWPRRGASSPRQRSAPQCTPMWIACGSTATACCCNIAWAECWSRCTTGFRRRSPPCCDKPRPAAGWFGLCCAQWWRLAAAG